MGQKVEVDTGQRGGVTSEMAEIMKALKREVYEQKQANEVLRKRFVPPLSRRLTKTGLHPSGRNQNLIPDKRQSRPIKRMLCCPNIKCL